MILLPIDDFRNEIAESLKKASRLTLVASPGSGKSTRVPYYISKDLAPKGKIIVLQPRRAAAMMLAKRVCDETQSSLKEQIGYQVKGDNQSHATTQIVYMTPGIFLRKCTNPSYLKEISYLILDEIHERSLELDLCLTLSLHWQTQHADLKLLAMSATLDETTLGQTFKAPVVRCDHKPHELELIYHSGSLIDAIKDYLRQAKEKKGNLLVFESGRREIEQTLKQLHEAGFSDTYECLALYGEMPLSEQNTILSEGQKPRIIVSTNIAETSLTLPGVRAVFDTGQCKLLRRDISSGANQLKKEWISKDRADQRAGRAARTGPGVAYRLWSKQQQNALRPYTDPEIIRCDVSNFVMWLAAYELPLEKAQLLTLPSSGALEKCQKDLLNLNFIEPSFKLTELGKDSLNLPLHPKFSKILLNVSSEQLEPACKLTAYLEGQVPCPKVKPLQKTEFLSDLIELLEREQHPLFKKEVKNLKQSIQQLNHDQPNTPLNSLEMSCISAMPEQLCFTLPSKKNQYRVLGGGTGSYLCDDTTKLPSILWAAQIQFKSKGLQNANLQWVIPLKEKQLAELFPNSFEDIESYEWNQKAQAMQKVTTTTFLQEVKLKQKNETVDFSHDYIESLSDMILNGEVELPHWQEQAQAWLLRYRQFTTHCSNDDHLTFDRDDLLILIQEALSNMNSWQDLFEHSWTQTLESALSWDDLQTFEKQFPQSFQLHPKRKVSIQYFEDEPPKISSKLQDFYDLKQHPSIFNHKIPLRCELLAPNQRPVQTTQDILGFWEGSYQQVKKDLYRRYPKHEWR